MAISTENDALIQQMIQDAKPAPEPGTAIKGQVIHSGDDTLESPMIGKDITSAGYVYVYDTETGDRSVINRNMLLPQLKKKKPNGKPAFTVIDPHIKQVKGSCKCMLHPDDPKRAYYDTLGLPVCKKSNLTSPFQVRRHMQKRHKQEWETIQEETRLIKEEEEKAFQRLIIQQSQGAKAIPRKETTAATVEAINDEMGSDNEQPILQRVDSTETETYVSDKPVKEKPRAKKTKRK